MSLESLERVRNEIERFPAVLQQQVHALLCEGKADVQETTQGALVNLGAVSEELLAKIVKYAEYVKKQEANMAEDEQTKDELRESYFGTTAEQT